MRSSSKQRHRQRAQLDAKLARVRPMLAQTAVPRAGWLKAVRESLGLSAERLGDRLGISKQVVLQIEKGEIRKTVTLASLERAARAMGCQLVYAIVSDEPLDAQLERRARDAARRQLERVGQSMALEAQAVAPELHELQVSELARELKEKLAPELWEEP